MTILFTLPCTLNALCSKWDRQSKNLGLALEFYKLIIYVLNGEVGIQINNIENLNYLIEM